MQVAVTLVLFTSDVNSTAATTMDYFFLVHPVYAYVTGYIKNYVVCLFV